MDIKSTGLTQTTATQSSSPVGEQWEMWRPEPASVWRGRRYSWTAFSQHQYVNSGFFSVSQREKGAKIWQAGRRGLPSCLTCRMYLSPSNALQELFWTQHNIEARLQEAATASEQGCPSSALLPLREPPWRCREPRALCRTLQLPQQTLGGVSDPSLF